MKLDAASPVRSIWGDLPEAVTAYLSLIEPVLADALEPAELLWELEAHLDYRR